MQMKVRAVNEALLLEALWVIFVALADLVNEYLDLPNMLLHGPPPDTVAPVEWPSSPASCWCSRRGHAACPGHVPPPRVPRVRSDLCAGCQRVGDEGRWLEFELFVEARDRLETTHGMCPDCQVTLGPAFSRPSRRNEPSRAR